MDNKELSKALLKYDATATTDLAASIRAVLDQDRRRVRRMAVATIALWVLATGMVVWVMASFVTFILPKIQVMAIETIRVIGGHAEAPAPWSNEDVVSSTVWLIEVFIKTAAWSVVFLGLAALCTVGLIFASRRATLRQINASLLEISEQLKQLRQAGTK